MDKQDKIDLIFSFVGALIFAFVYVSFINGIAFFVGIGGIAFIILLSSKGFVDLIIERKDNNESKIN